MRRSAAGFKVVKNRRQLQKLGCFAITLLRVGREFFARNHRNPFTAERVKIPADLFSKSRHFATKQTLPQTGASVTTASDATVGFNHLSYFVMLLAWRPS